MAGKATGSGNASRRPSRAVLSDETHDAIMELILDHQIAPGEHINIDALARDLDVSQTPVREALARLESEDLVVKKALRGYTATPLLTPEQVDDLFRFRALIEPWAASRAAVVHTEDDAAAILAELDGARQVDASDFDAAYAELGRHDARFHELVARTSGSAYLADALTRTHCHMHMHRLYQARKSFSPEQQSNPEFVETVFREFYTPETGFLTVQGHSEIAEAIFARDADRAGALMLDHIEGSRIRNSSAIQLLGGR
ncbi:DNA-binding GntR family transcriptional regulator [Microterricola gilva]|uniref:DNA-binding GntR family transcriptional regulator n=2 Tax=Microterricola gilva TaxID=393267 RepID=A0A4Q8AQS2_9MICO|nr:DNA-binding GntR family transcriptional regulator [Microterricola gilva]